MILIQRQESIRDSNGESSPRNESAGLADFRSLLNGSQCEFLSAQRLPLALLRQQQSRGRVQPGQLSSDSWLLQNASAKFPTDRSYRNIQSANFDKATLSSQC